MTSWVRLWHDMPTDPKWRVISRKSKQPIDTVIVVFAFAMVNASANANERGRTHNLCADDIGAAIDRDGDAVQAILDAMEGKVIKDGWLLGWEKRQPKREDGSAERAASWRERNRTQTNASERPDSDADSDSDSIGGKKKFSRKGTNGHGKGKGIREGVQHAYDAITAGEAVCEGPGSQNGGTAVSEQRSGSGANVLTLPVAARDNS